MLCAVSGGVDSTVLLDVMSQLAQKHNFSLAVAHYNHNLRGEESDEDEVLVKKMAEDYNIKFYGGSGKIKQFAERNSLSIEHAARVLRYKFFERTSRTVNADFLATAHTSDDSVETFLLNMIRGSGLTGLSGIPSKRTLVKNVQLIRPLIELSKDDLIQYARKRKLKWREDKSNALLNYTRNKIRNELLPYLRENYNPSISDIINRTAGLIHGADGILSVQVKNNLDTIMLEKGSDKFAVNLPLLRTFDEFFQSEMIQEALQRYFNMQPQSLATIERIMKLEESKVGAICEINKNFIVLRDRQSLIFTRTQPEYFYDEIIRRTGVYEAGNNVLKLIEVKYKDIDFNNNPNIEYFDFDLVPAVLHFRSWEEGDTFNPLGMTGTMKVSDFLTNQKVPLIEKPNVMLLSAGREILWICGMRISDKFKVNDSTKRYLKAEYKSR